MGKYFQNAVQGLLGMGVFCIFLSGCWLDTPKAVIDDYVLKSGDILISTLEFSEELELSRAAYPYSIQTDHQAFNTLVMNVVDQLSEELVIRREAHEKGILVSEADIDSAERIFREDYPDKTFEAMLLDNAVSYSFWRKRLGINLITKALIAKEVDAAIEITADEVARYYDEYKKQFQTEDDSNAQPQVNEKDLIALLRMKKAEEVYPGFIKALGKHYPVEINRQKLAAFLK
ncbi:MAG: hypothetical protein V1793_10280 [Pseudomonadota bacterium]